jgi:hypothetical protein
VNALSPRETRAVVTAVGSVTMAILGGFVGVVIGGLLGDERSDAAGAIHVAALPPEALIGLVLGGVLGLVGGGAAGLGIAGSAQSEAAGRVGRVIGEAMFGIAGAMLGFFGPLLAIYIGLGVGVFLGGRMLGGKGEAVAVAVGVAVGGALGAGIFILLFERQVPGLEWWSELGPMVLGGIALSLPLAGAIIGFERPNANHRMDQA